MTQDLSGLAKDSALDLERLRTRLSKMSDAELISFGKQMHELDSRAEWRSRRSLGTKTPRAANPD